MPTVPLEFVKTHHDVPENAVGGFESFEPGSKLGVSKYVAELPGNYTLRSLLVNKGSGTLIVALHGATNRAKKELPRFEWFRTLRTERYSSLYFSDPLLEIDPTLELAWYTGPVLIDMHRELARWISRSAVAVGASRIVILGSSGGGFAALQIAPLIEGSLALPFSPQTALANYRVGGTGLGAQRKYLQVVMPELAPERPLGELAADMDWSEPLSDRLSALVRYSRLQKNFVYFVQNIHDVPHVEQHYEPFRNVVENGPNLNHVQFDLYEGPVGHNPPSTDEFYRALHEALRWHLEAWQP